MWLSVIIPALACTLDKSFKEDRSLSPVRALCYYLDRTKDLRDNKQFLFSFKKNFDRDVSPVTISSKIKQSVLLCYKLLDQEALQVHQVTARDVRNFAASKAFKEESPYSRSSRLVTGSLTTPSHSFT